MTFESLMTLTDDSEMRWAEWLGNALVRMSEDLNLKNQTVWRLSLQIQTDWRHSLKNTVLGQRLNPKLLEKPWAGGTLFFEDLDAKTVKELSVLSRNFPCCHQTSTEQKKAKTYGFASFRARKRNMVKMVADPDPLSCVLHHPSQRAMPDCKRGDPSNAGHADLHSHITTP